MLTCACDTFLETAAFISQPSIQLAHSTDRPVFDDLNYIVLFLAVVFLQIAPDLVYLADVHQIGQQNVALSLLIRDQLSCVYTRA